MVENRQTRDSNVSKRKSIISAFVPFSLFPSTGLQVNAPLNSEVQAESLERESSPLGEEIPPQLVDLVFKEGYNPSDTTNSRSYHTQIFESAIKKYFTVENDHDIQQFCSVFNKRDPKFIDVYGRELSDFDKYEKSMEIERYLKHLLENQYEETKKSKSEVQTSSVDQLSKFYAEETDTKKKSQKSTNAPPSKRVSSTSTVDIDDLGVMGSPDIIGTPTLSETLTSPTMNSSKLKIDDCDTLGGATAVTKRSFNSDPEKNQHVSPPGIQRKLSSRTLQMIAFGSALGNGLLLYSGKNLTISGPLGTLLGFGISGLVVLASMLSYCEVVTVIPVADGISGLASRFIDEAYGFALGWTYWFAFTISIPAEIIAGLVMLNYGSGESHNAIIGWVFLFVTVVNGVNLLDVRWFGEVEYACNFVKLSFMIVVSVVSVIVNTGGSPTKEKIGTKFWTQSMSANNGTFGPFRPSYDLDDVGFGALGGLTGGFGRFMAIMTSVGIASYAYCGTEIVGIAASEAKNPRKSLPPATKKVFWRIIIFYVLAVGLVGLNVYSGDPRLLRYISPSEKKNPYTFPFVEAEYTHLSSLNLEACIPKSSEDPYSSANKSPWVIAAQSVGMCDYASIIDQFIVFFTISSASAQLYASSRTLHALSMQSKAPQVFKRCTQGGVPYVAVLSTGIFGFLAFFAMSDSVLTVFEYFATLSSTFVILTWGGMCFSFIRYYYALQLRSDIISRSYPAYPFKSPCQPYLAYFGFIGTCLIIFFLGVAIFVSGFEVTVFLASYGATIIFIIAFFGYKFTYKTRMKKLDQIDLDTGRKEMDKEDWEEKMNDNNFNFWKMIKAIF